ncbi:MAG: DUF4384 domain-containing protein [Bacteroidetes bacterium]|nr:DUF4384 domain-containing protein [Bacteroidota bacterium]MCL2302234.1 DUF4384 domain-containing protein [Lentimicrobiaceae bacterium]MCL2302314.1 DUF4384 domain-containing protein [Lentimicrobiaceae bacterium]
MRKMYKLFILGILLFVSHSLFAQTKTVEAEGMWQIANITPEKARMLAMERAKAKALEEAGIETFVSSSTSTVSDLVENFINFSNSEIIGEFTDIKILEDRPVVIDDIVFYKVRIRAKVKTNNVKYDPGFDAQVSGFAVAYNEGDNLQFSVTPTKDCYVQIFWFDDTGNGGILYPNEMEKTQPLKAKTEKTFPQSDQLEYTLYKETKEDMEGNSFVFVFTKKERPYSKATKDGSTTLDDLYQWIIKIPSDQRVTKQEAIFIGRKGR